MTKPVNRAAFSMTPPTSRRAQLALSKAISRFAEQENSPHLKRVAKALRDKAREPLRLV